MSQGARSPRPFPPDRRVSQLAANRSTKLSIIITETETMPEQNDFNNYLPEQKPEDYSIEIPADQAPLNLDRVPSGDDLMGRIEQRGMAYSRLARGLAPWWILIAGWVVFGGLALGLLRMALGGSIVSWVLLAMVLLPLVILAQGTVAKLTSGSRS